MFWNGIIDGIAPVLCCNKYVNITLSSEDVVYYYMKRFGGSPAERELYLFCLVAQPAARQRTNTCFVPGIYIVYIVHGSLLSTAINDTNNIYKVCE